VSLGPFDVACRFAATVARWSEETIAPSGVNDAHAVSEADSQLTASPMPRINAVDPLRMG
jgi:hypothetical protein